MWVLLGSEPGSFQKTGSALNCWATFLPYPMSALGFLASALPSVLYFHAYKLYFTKRNLFTFLHLSMNCFLQYLTNILLVLFFVSVFQLKPLSCSLCLLANEVSGTKCTSVGAMWSLSLGWATSLPPDTSHTSVSLRVSMIWLETASLVQAVSAYLLSPSPFWCSCHARSLFLPITHHLCQYTAKLQIPAIAISLSALLSHKSGVSLAACPGPRITKSSPILLPSLCGWQIRSRSLRMRFQLWEQRGKIIVA